MLAALEDLYGEWSSKFEEPFTDEPFTRMYFWEGPVCKIMFFLITMIKANMILMFFYGYPLKKYPLSV